MTTSPLEIVSSGHWEKAFFSTYALSLSFFEGVVLDALIRRRNREALILADVAGVRSALSERGARRVGRDYEVEPVNVTGGCFHPKVSALMNVDDIHILVGSGNLTFGGWGNNLEVIEHLHPSFSPEAVRDVADFFEQIATVPRLHHAAGDRCGELADDIRRRVGNNQSDGTIRVIHSLEGSIVDRLEEISADLGPARKLLVASPFWDTASSGIDALCRRFGLETVHVHVHPGEAVHSAQGLDWPWNSTKTIVPVAIRHFIEDGGDRLLHAKAYELEFAKGRLIVSGSANATNAALGEGHNVEACVVRIQRDRNSFWFYDPTVPPERIDKDSEDESFSIEDVGVLRATLEGDWLRGTVLTGLKSGTATASLVTSENVETIGTLRINEDGTFGIRAMGLEIGAWRAERVIVRLSDDDGNRAEGFASLVAVSGIIRRIGPIGRSLTSIISMNGTPEDIAAMMEWLNDNPDRYPREVPNGGNGGDVSVRSENRILVLSDVLNETEDGRNEPAGQTSVQAQGAIRFFRMLLAAFRTPVQRNADAIGDYVAEDQSERMDGNSQPSSDELAREKVFGYFEDVFEAMLGRGSPEFAHAALELMLFICDRLEPDFGMVRRWMVRIEHSVPTNGFTSEGKASLRSGVVAIAAAAGAAPATTRGRLLKLGLSLDDTMPDFRSTPGVSHLAGEVNLDAFWTKIRSSLSLPEQNKSYLDQLRGLIEQGTYPDLKADPDTWHVLGNGLAAHPSWNRAIEARPGSMCCPLCNIGLPSSEVRKLQTRYVAKALNCCNRIILKTVP